MELHNGSLMHIISNNTNNTNSNTTTSYYPKNIAINYQTYSFVNDNLIISRNVDRASPEFIVFELYDFYITLDALYRYSKEIYVSLEIGGQQMIEFPLHLLWNLRTPEIMEYKLYIHFPFEQFFGDIFLHSLHYHEVSFKLKNLHHLVNYVSNCSLICKTYIYGIRDNLYGPSGNNIIQQISSLNVSVSEGQSDEFVVNTSIFRGIIKGFFIQGQEITELRKFQLYINGHLRTNYDKFLIRNKCIKINDNLLYFPFNSDFTFSDRQYNSYDGAINFSNLNSSVMRLQFDAFRSDVKIYSLNMNYYQQNRGFVSLLLPIQCFHLSQDFTAHPLITQEQIVANPTPITAYTESSTNYTQVNNNINNNINNINHTYDTSGNYYNDLPILQMAYRVIPNDRNTCGITLEEIKADESYMSCGSCHNNFKEDSIKNWLRSHQTCPSCRANWSDFTIYINTVTSIS